MHIHIIYTHVYAHTYILHLNILYVHTHTIHTYIQYIHTLQCIYYERKRSLKFELLYLYNYNMEKDQI